MANAEKTKDLIGFLENEIISSEDDAQGGSKIDADETDQLAGDRKKTSLGLNGASPPNLTQNGQGSFTPDAVPDLEESSDKDQQEEFFSETFDEDEDEITLSVDELDEIIEDAAEVPEKSKEAPETLEENFDSGEAVAGDPFAEEDSEVPDDIFSETSEKGEIALSGDELDKIIEDATNVSEGSPETLEEGSHSEGTETGDEPSEEKSPDSEETAGGDPPAEEVSEAPSDDVFSETPEEAGEISLSGDELDDIIEDSTKASEESPEAPETLEEVFRSEETETGDEASEEESPDSEETAGGDSPAEEVSEAPSDDVFSETSEEEEEIALSLSGDELDDIIEDSTKASEESPEVGETLEEVFRSGGTETGDEPSEEKSPDSEETVSIPPPAEEASDTPSDDIFSETSEEEEIALSGDELDEIIEDAANVSGENPEAGETREEVPLSEDILSSGEPSENESLDFEEAAASEPLEEEGNTDLSEKSQESAPDLKDTDDPAAEEALDAPSDDFFSETFRGDDEEKLFLDDDQNEPVEDAHQASAAADDSSDDSPLETVPGLHELQPELSVDGSLGDQQESTDEAKNRIQLSEELSSQELDKGEIKKMLSYLDDLLGELPDDVIKKFSQSEYFSLYKKVIQQLGI